MLVTGTVRYMLGPRAARPPTRARAGPGVGRAWASGPNCFINLRVEHDFGRFNLKVLLYEVKFLPVSP